MLYENFITCTTGSTSTTLVPVVLVVVPPERRSTWYLYFQVQVPGTGTVPGTPIFRFRLLRGVGLCATDVCYELSRT